jgi:hypothetical protein
MNLKWFTYDQNNSGGSFDFDADRGISSKVIIQARDTKEANFRASRIGLYFDGSGDCRCCGDRWSEQYGEGFDTLMIYGNADIETWMTSPYFMKRMGPDRPEVYVHAYDDTFEGFVYGTPRVDLRLRENRELES